MKQGFILILLFCIPAAEAEDFLVCFGTHRTIATVIQVKNGTLTPDTVVGKIDGEPLTAKKVVELYDAGLLRTRNSNFRGVPWFSDSKAEEIYSEFDVKKFFDPSRDEGLGVVITSKRRGVAPFSELKGDYGNGESVGAFIAKHLKSADPCAKAFEQIAAQPPMNRIQPNTPQ